MWTDGIKLYYVNSTENLLLPFKESKYGVGGGKPTLHGGFFFFFQPH